MRQQPPQSMRSILDALRLLLFATVTAAVFHSSSIAAKQVQLLDGCKLAAAAGNGSNLNITLSAQPPATELQLHFVGCSLESVHITLVAPNSESVNATPPGGTSIVLEHFTMHNGSFVISPALPIAADNATRPLVESISVTAKHVFMEGLVDALVVNATSAVNAASGAVVAARNVTFAVSDSTVTSPRGGALSIAVGDGMVVDCFIHVAGHATISAGGRLASSVEAAVVNNTNLTASGGSVTITAGTDAATLHNGVAALGIVQYRSSSETTETSTLLLSNVHITASSQQRACSPVSTGIPLLLADGILAVGRSQLLIITATGDTCVAAAGACSAHDVGTADVTLDGAIAFVVSLQNNDSVLADASNHAAAAAGIALSASSTSYISITRGASVTIMGWVHDGATIEASVSSHAAAALGFALHGSSSDIAVSEGATITLLGWAHDNAMISANAGSYTAAAAVLGIALSGTTGTTTIATSEGVNVTIVGWARQNAMIQATSNAVAAALGFALRCYSSDIVISEGATITFMGWAHDNATIQATASPGTAAAAAIGIALSASPFSATISISRGATITILGWARQNATIQATSHDAVATLGMALYGTSATTISISGGAEVTILGWAQANATIQATASNVAAATLGIALHGTITTVTVSGGANVTILGWAQENAIIQATTINNAAAALGIALLGTTGTTTTTAISISEGANVTFMGWAQENATIQATASGVATALGMALFGTSTTSTLSISEEANVALMGWAQENATIQATASSNVAALGMMMYAYTSNIIAISGGANVAIKGWAQENATIQASCTKYAAIALGIGGYIYHATLYSSTISITDRATVAMEGWAERGGSIRASASLYMAVVLGLYVRDSIYIANTNGAGASVQFCHDSSSTAVSVSPYKALYGSSPVAPALQRTTSADLLDVNSSCAQESRRHETEADVIAGWAASVFSAALADGPSANTTMLAIIMSGPLWICDAAEQVGTRTASQSSTLSPTSLTQTPSLAGSASLSASEAISRSVTHMPTATDSPSPSLTSNGGTTATATESTAATATEPSASGTPTGTFSLSAATDTPSPSSSHSASTSSCSPAMTASTSLPRVPKPRPELLPPLNGTISKQASLLLSMAPVSTDASSSNESVSSWNEHSSNTSGTSFEVPFDIYTNQQLCIFARFPRISDHRWKKSEKVSPFVPSDYVRITLARSTFSDDQLNVSVSSEKQVGRQLKICFGAVKDVNEWTANIQRVVFHLREDAVQPQPESFNTTNTITILFLPGWKPNQGATTVVVVASSVSGAASLIGAGPTAAAVSNRQQLLAKIIMCPQPMVEEPLGSDQSPLGLRIGTGFLRYEAGAMYGNLLFFAGLALAFATLTIIVGSQVDPQKFASRVLPSANNVDSGGGKSTAWQRGRATLRFPGRLAPVAIFLYQATLSSSLRVVLYTENTSGDSLHQYVAVAVAALLICSFAVLPLASSFAKLVGASISHVHRSSISFHSFVEYLTNASGEWASMPANTDPHDRPVAEAVERFGTAFEDYRPECVSTIYCDALLATVCACAAAINPISSKECSMLSFFIACTFLLAVVVAVGFRPFDSRLNNVFYAVIAIAQFISAVAINAMNENSSNSAEWMSRMEISDAVLSFTITIWCLLQVAEGIYCTVQATGVAPGLPTLAEAMDTVVFNFFCERITQAIDNNDDDVLAAHEALEPTMAISAESEVLAAVEEAHPVLADAVNGLGADPGHQRGTVTVHSTT